VEISIPMARAQITNPKPKNIRSPKLPLMGTPNHKSPSARENIKSKNPITT
jgi:hypothetical protein